MKRGRLPLTALRSFEAAGRLASFTAAADELHVSQAAISRQVRELEAMLGQPLFERRHRSVALTAAGSELLTVLTASFDAVDGALSTISEMGKAHEVTISCEPSFAVLWLVNHLEAFRQLWPDVDVTIDSDPRPIEFRASHAEIAIRYSADRNSWPRTESMLLTPTDMLAVASRDFVESMPPIRSPSDLLACTRLHIENRDMWSHWFAAAGVTVPERDRGPVFDDAALVLQAVLRGHGIGLVDRLFVTEDIAAGRIVKLFDVDFPCGAFYLVARSLAALSPGAARFRDWIKSELVPQPIPSQEAFSG